LEVSGQLHAVAALPRVKAPGIHWIGGWVDIRVGLDDVEKRKFLTVPGLELRSLGRPARSQSLYRLRYSVTIIIIIIIIIIIPASSPPFLCISKTV
jgi:hypothetical protein